MKIDKMTPSFQDARGAITDVLKQGHVEYVTIITSKKGAVRANHFHKDTYQYLYVMEGKLRVRAQNPGGPVEEAIMSPGDLTLNAPLESHAFEALEDSIFLVLTKGPRGGEDYEKDTYRLDDPLIPRN